MRTDTRTDRQTDKQTDNFRPPEQTEFVTLCSSGGEALPIFRAHYYGTLVTQATDY